MYDVSVVLALNKIDTYTYEAIDSVVNQLEVRHEVIIVVNGIDYLKLYESLFSRYSMLPNLTILYTNIPQLAYSLNLGVSKSNSNYIARMDGDDVSFPYRLSVQLDYLKKHRLDMVGSDAILIDQDSKELGYKTMPKNSNINFIKGNPFIHPTVIFSKEFFYKARGYNAGFNSEDYDLWLRFLRLNVKWDNVPRALVKYRLHSNSTQGSSLAYCEVGSYYFREFFISPSFIHFLGFLFSIVKIFLTKVKKSKAR